MVTLKFTSGEIYKHNIVEYLIGPKNCANFYVTRDLKIWIPIRKSFLC
jgi:hypothetical protein